MTQDQQREVIDFLSNVKAFSDGSDAIDVVQTHAAIIFLGHSDVFKIKRAVKYPYLDQSNLAKRKALCDNELKINQSTAPCIYIGVVPITREADGRLSISGAGPAVEWAIHMQRFAEADLLSNIAVRGDLTPQICSQLGAAIVSYHKGLKPVMVEDGADRIEEIASELIAAFIRFTEDLPAKLPGDFKRKIERRFDASRPFLDARGRQGFIRRCHGDLHLRNIVLLNGRPTPFDALEFNERLATIDVLYDLAFLLSDVLHHNLTKQANIIFNRYLLAGWEMAMPAGLRALPLFLSLRAAIRAMVSLQTGGCDNAQADQMKVDAVSYLKEAIDYLHDTKPVLVAVGGLSGSGKSTLAAALAPPLGIAPGAILLRSDLERKAMFKVDEFEHLPEHAYSRDVTAEVYARLMEKAQQSLDQGYSVVLDAVFQRPDERQAALQAAMDSPTAFCGLWLDAPDDVLLNRVGSRINDASDADADIVKLQLSRQRQNQDNLTTGWRAIDASGSPMQTLDNAKTKLCDIFDLRHGAVMGKKA